MGEWADGLPFILVEGHMGLPLFGMESADLCSTFVLKVSISKLR